MLALSGGTLAAGSTAVLAACGSAVEEEEASPAEDAALLNEVLAQQLGVIDAIEAGLSSLPMRTVRQPSFALRVERIRSSQALAKAIGELGGSATQEPAPRAAQAESAVEGVARQLEASIAGTLEALGELSAEQRATVQRAITEDAALLAVLRAELGEEPAPDAFVLGPPGEEAS